MGGDPRRPNWLWDNADPDTRFNLRSTGQYADEIRDYIEHIESKRNILGELLQYTEEENIRLKVRLCERCKDTPWSLGQLLRCDECLDMEPPVEPKEVD